MLQSSISCVTPPPFGRLQRLGALSEDERLLMSEREMKVCESEPRTCVFPSAVVIHCMHAL